MSIRRALKSPVLFWTGIFFISGIWIYGGIKSASAEIADHLVINEVHIDGVVGAGGTDDDWVELYNPTANPVALDAWSIQKFSSSGSTAYNQPLSGQIEAGGYLLIVRNGNTTKQELKDMADILANESFSIAADNIIYLVSNQNVVVPGSVNANIIDYVGFGSALYYEGTAAAPGVSETKSISRVPDGEDSNDNSGDFLSLNTPTPQNSSNEPDSNLNGNVLLTVTPDINPVRNIGAVSAQIVFRVNSDGSAYVSYGGSQTYGQTSALAAVQANTDVSIDLDGLSCGTEYHYQISAADPGATENDLSPDATFTTLPCGIDINSITMTKIQAKAKGTYSDGWEWVFNITVWDTLEDELKMMFDSWSGAMSLDSADNMRFSVDSGLNWIDINENSAYPTSGADISGIDLGAETGRQVSILVEMRVPVGTLTGTYSSNYGILTQ